MDHIDTGHGKDVRSLTKTGIYLYRTGTGIMNVRACVYEKKRDRSYSEEGRMKWLSVRRLSRVRRSLNRIR